MRNDSSTTGPRTFLSIGLRDAAGPAAAATGPDGLALLPSVPLGSMMLSAEEAFGPGCRALADGGMVGDTTLLVEAGTVTAVDVICY